MSAGDTKITATQEAKICWLRITGQIELQGAEGRLRLHPLRGGAEVAEPQERK